MEEEKLDDVRRDRDNTERVSSLSLSPFWNENGS